MANYSHLIVCATDDFPDLSYDEDKDWSPYPPVADTSPSYEAKYSIPLFWLCLFEEKHLRRVLLPDDEKPVTGYAVPALFVSSQEAAENLLRRRPLLKRVLPASELALFDEFAERVERDYGPFLLVIAEEVAMMGEEGEYAASIGHALQIMETLPPEEWTEDFDFADVTGLKQNSPMGNPGWYTLIGYDDVSDWPEEPEEKVEERQKTAQAAISPEVHGLHARAQEGDAEAQYALGLALLEGKGVKQNGVLAWKWFSDAAKQGHAEAQFMTGKLHADGTEIPRGFEAAAEWLRKAADQGLPHAQQGLGLLHEKGYGVAQDREQAVYWYSKAVNQDYAPAMVALASLYAGSEDSAAYRSVARDLLLRAAGQNPGESEKYRALLDQFGDSGAAGGDSAPGDSKEDSGEASLLQAVHEASENSTKPLLIEEHAVRFPLFKGAFRLLLLLTLAPPFAAGWLYSWWWLFALPLSFFVGLIIIGTIRKDFCIDMEKQTIRWQDVIRPFAEVDPSEFRIEAGHESVALRYCPPGKKHIVVGVFTGPEATVAAERLRDALLALLSGIRSG